MKKTIHRFILVLGLIGMATTAQAQQQDGPPRDGGPRVLCRQDAQKFCQGVQPGGGRIKDCLEDHYKELSDACYNALKNAPPPPQDNEQQSSPRGGSRQEQIPRDDNNDQQN